MMPLAAKFKLPSDSELQEKIDKYLAAQTSPTQINIGCEMVLSS